MIVVLTYTYKTYEMLCNWQVLDTKDYKVLAEDFNTSEEAHEWALLCKETL